MRYFLYISYRGTNYHGWQVQDNAVTVQKVLSGDLCTILQQPVSIVGSGRTDTGVHARMQVVHFDLDHELDPQQFVHQLNSKLPYDISANKVVKVKDDVSSRFDAVWREYRYRINRKKDPFLKGLSYHYHKDLDIDLMNEACEQLKQWEDFECFSRVKTEVNNFLCTIMEAKWISQNDQLQFSVRANRFLRGMVRAMVGTLLDIGTKKIGLERFKMILESRDRTKAGRAVPAEGLYLHAIAYPSEIFLETENKH